MTRRRLQRMAGLATVALCGAAARADDLTTQLIPPLPGTPAVDGAALAARPNLAWVVRQMATRHEVWRTGGTPETTYLVTTVDLVLDPVEGGFFRLFASEQGRIAWIETRSAGDHRLWWTDGTPGPLARVALADGELELRWTTPTLVGSDLFLIDYDPLTQFDARMLRCDAGAPGLARSLELWNALGVSQTSSVVGGREVHFERHGVDALALVATDGTDAGTDVLTGGLPATLPPLGEYGDFGARFVGKGGDLATFVVDSGVGAQTLWITDGTPAGTRPVRLLASWSGYDAQAAATSRFALGAVAGEPGEGTVLVTDGTEGGTFLESTPAMSYFGIVAGATRGFFRSYVGDAQVVWTTDGTPDGTVPLPRVSAPSQGFIVGNKIVPLDAPDGAMFTDHSGDVAAWYTSPSQYSRRIAVPAPDQFHWTVRAPRTVGRRLLVPVGDSSDPSWNVALLDDLTIRPGRIDTDGDRVPDEVEEQLGASAFDAGETPIGGAAGAAKPLSVTRVRGRVEGTAATIDAVAKFRLRSPKGRAAPRLGRVAVSFGGVVTKFDVGRRGTASLPDGSYFRTRTRTARNGTVTGTVSLRVVSGDGGPRLLDEFGRTDDATGAPAPYSGLTVADIAVFTAAATWRARTGVYVTVRSGGSLHFASSRRAAR